MVGSEGMVQASGLSKGIEVSNSTKSSPQQRCCRIVMFTLRHGDMVSFANAAGVQLPPTARMTGDDVYGEVAARYPEAAVIVPPRSSAVPSEATETAPTRHNRHLQSITKHGRWDGRRRRL
jgi:hypothetical protein